MPKILVIEDDADMVMAIRLPLEANDYEVFEAAMGAEGLQKVKEIEPDLIILRDDGDDHRGFPGLPPTPQPRPRFGVRRLPAHSDPDADGDPHHHVPALWPR